MENISAIAMQYRLPSNWCLQWNET